MSVLQKRIGLFLKTAVFSSNLLTQSTKLVVGVSGGPDSLALLHALTQVVAPSRLIVAHLNHGYRETAVSEATFVRNLAEKWGVSFETQSLNVSQLAEETGDSLEEAGRKARYSFFCEIAKTYETSYIIVGHHRDDQAETVLMNLLRGTGLRGLRGMLPVTPLDNSKVGHSRYFVLRPFLSVSRQEIEAYCQIHELSPVFDESNEDASFFRNRIRQELLPLLEDYNSGIRSHLQQLAELTAADVALLDGLMADTWTQVVLETSDSAVVLNREAWAELPLGLRRAILRQAVVEKRPFLQDITFQAIEQARLVAEKNETGQRFSLPGNLFLIIDYDRLIIAEDAHMVLDDWPQLVGSQSKKLLVPGQVDLENGWKIKASLVDEVNFSEIRSLSDDWLVFIAAPVDKALFVRTRQPGERFQPLGMNGRSAKVKEVMINRKLGAKWRGAWPLVSNADHLVWLVGHSIDERVKLNEETTPILQLSCYRG